MDTDSPLKGGSGSTEEAGTGKAAERSTEGLWSKFIAFVKEDCEFDPYEKELGPLKSTQVAGQPLHGGYETSSDDH